MPDTPTRYPLQWPVGWKRTPPQRRTEGRFTSKQYSGQGRQEAVTVAQAVDRLLAELERFAVAERNVIISTNVEPTLSGRPRSGERKPQDPGAAVYWRDYAAAGGPKDRCMAIDRYTDVAQNIAALAATIEAMRAIERHGGAAILDRAFTGFTALPAPIAAGMKRDWWVVLDCSPTAGREAIEYAYKRLASKYHPDRAPEGEREEYSRRMAEVNTARDEALLQVTT